MLNPNTKPVLTFEEKRSTPILPMHNMSGVPLVVRSYDESTDLFTIAADTRYEEKGRDTAFYDIDDFQVPALLIHHIVADLLSQEDPHEIVGVFFLATS